MAKWCIGIDLGGTYIKFGLLDERRRPSETFQLPTPTDRGADGVVEQMIAGGRRVVESTEGPGGWPCEPFHLPISFCFFSR